MIGLEVCIKAAQGQFFLQISVESERVLLCYQDANLLIIGAEVPQNAFGHPFKSALNESVRYNYTINKGLEASRDVYIAHFKLHISSCQVNRHQALLDILYALRSMAWSVVVIHRDDTLVSLNW